MYCSFFLFILSLLVCLYGRVQYGGYIGLSKTNSLSKEDMPS